MTQPKDKRGRPKAQEPGSAVMTWLKASEHDQLVRLAKERDQSVSAMVRDLLKQNLRP